MNVLRFSFAIYPLPFFLVYAGVFFFDLCMLRLGAVASK